MNSSFSGERFLNAGVTEPAAVAISAGQTISLQKCLRILDSEMSTNGTSVIDKNSSLGIQMMRFCTFMNSSSCGAVSAFHGKQCSSASFVCPPDTRILTQEAGVPTVPPISHVPSLCTWSSEAKLPTVVDSFHAKYGHSLAGSRMYADGNEFDSAATGKCGPWLGSGSEISSYFWAAGRRAELRPETQKASNLLRKRAVKEWEWHTSSISFGEAVRESKTAGVVDRTKRQRQLPSAADNALWSNHVFLPIFVMFHLNPNGALIAVIWRTVRLDGMTCLIWSVRVSWQRFWPHGSFILTLLLSWNTQ